MQSSGTSLRFVLAPYGSSGDVYPFLWLARGLQARGHRVTIALSGAHTQAANALGVPAISLGTAEEFHRLADDPLLWHPSLGPWKVMGAVARLFDRSVETTGRLLKSPGTVIVAPAQNFSMRFLAEKLGRRLITIHLQPIMLLSAESTPVLMAGFEWLCHAPRWMRRFFIHHMPNPADFCLGRLVRKKCREAGITAPRRLLTDWWNSPDGVVCLFPEWFAPPQSDWPPGVFQTGFPCFDLPSNAGESTRIEQFLHAGPPPVVFTAGSAMRSGRAFFSAALEAISAIGGRAIFVAAYPEQIPRPLPPSVLHTEYARFSSLFPSAAAVVHHGGIGTTAQAFAAGKPQLVIPMSHDQPDNAMRVERLGCGLRLPAPRANAVRMKDMLSRLLGSPDIARAAGHLRESVPVPGNPENAVLAIEQMLERQPRNRF